MAADLVKRSFPEEEVLKKLSFEKSVFLKEFIPELETLKQGNYCEWRANVRELANICQNEMKLRKMTLNSDITSMLASLNSDQSFATSSLILRLSQVLRDKSKNQLEEMQKRKDQLTHIASIYKVVAHHEESEPDTASGRN